MLETEFVFAHSPSVPILPVYSRAEKEGDVLTLDSFPSPSSFFGKDQRLPNSLIGKYRYNFSILPGYWFRALPPVKSEHSAGEKGYVGAP